LCQVGRTIEVFAPEIGRGLYIGGSQLLKTGVGGEESVGESSKSLTAVKTTKSTPLSADVDAMLKQLDRSIPKFDLSALPGVEMEQKGKSRGEQSPIGRGGVGFKPFIELWQESEQRGRIAPKPNTREFTFIDERQIQRQLQRIGVREELSLSSYVVSITRQTQSTSYGGGQGQGGGSGEKGKTITDIPKIPNTPPAGAIERHLYGRKTWRVSWFGGLDLERMLGVSTTKSKSSLTAVNKGKKSEGIFSINILGEQKPAGRKSSTGRGKSKGRKSK